MDWRVPLADVNIGPEEEAAVSEVIRSGWLTMGAVTQSFEAEFASFTGAKHALAVTNATAALHLACLALGVGAGDEVIVPSLTFVASANAIRYTGEGAPVEIRVGRESSGGRNHVVVEIRDHGPGVKESELRDILQPFRTVASDEKSGAGLGLSIADRIVKQSGGTLELANAPDGGLIVRFVLPEAPGGREPR